MKRKGDTFQSQEGAGFIFLTVESELWTGNYVVFQIPNAKSNEK
jgi:hypothetical protein